MTFLDLLDAAAASFVASLAHVGDDDWTLPTPCDDWDIGGLVDHVIGGNRFTALILAGSGADEALEAVTTAFEDEDDRKGEVAASLDRQRLAFRDAGTLDAICHHVAGDMPGSRVLRLRITDLTLHGWDLARAIGADETIEDRLVEAVWDDLEPRAGALGGTGKFGDGPSDALPADAPLQARVLDLAGRRP